MIGDTTYFNVCNEECSIWYYSERSALTKADTDEMYPYERQLTLDLFKSFEESLEEKRKEAEGAQSSKTSQTAW